MAFSWTTLDVRMNDGIAIEGEVRLAVLFLWLRGEASAQIVFVDPASGARVTDPMAVSWWDFPLQEAIDALQAARRSQSPDVEPIPRRRR
jgi:hypothetical protein